MKSLNQSLSLKRWQREVVEKFLAEKFSTASAGSLHWFVLMALCECEKRMQVWLLDGSHNPKHFHKLFLDLSKRFTQNFPKSKYIGTLVK